MKKNTPEKWVEPLKEKLRSLKIGVSVNEIVDYVRKIRQEAVEQELIKNEDMPCWLDEYFFIVPEILEKITGGKHFCLFEDCEKELEGKLIDGRLHLRQMYCDKHLKIMRKRYPIGKKTSVDSFIFAKNL
jgi:hypothetical protein